MIALPLFAAVFAVTAPSGEHNLTSLLPPSSPPLYISPSGVDLTPIPSPPLIRYQLPTFNSVPGQTAHIQHHIPDPLFDWEAHADINDTKRVELDFEIPNIDYEVTVLRAENIKRADVFGSSDAQCFVKFFNGREEIDLGKTACKRNTLNPEWRDETFTLSINASIEVENTWLLIDMFDCDVGPKGNDIPGDYLGCVELSGDAIEFLIADGKTHEVAYDLKPRQESAPDDTQEGITGTLHLKGGKAGFEVNFVACRTLVALPNLTSRVFGVVRSLLYPHSGVNLTPISLHPLYIASSSVH